MGIDELGRHQNEAGRAVTALESARLDEGFLHRAERSVAGEMLDRHNFGAKGVGETATFCVSPAIANAIDDACGVRLTELPLNPEAVFRALRARDGKPLEDDS